jgi:hypothetical protein
MMHTNLKYLTCFILLLTLSSAMAQHKTVDEAMHALRTLLIDPNQAGLEAISHPDLSYGHSSGKIENRSEFIDALVTGASDFVSAEFTGQNVAVTGKTAMVRHTLQAELRAVDGTVSPIRLHILLIWVRQKGGWKLLARQAVRLS